MADFHHLEAAARRVIHQLQQLPEFRQVRILIIGGLALWQYLPDHRRTDDVDFLVGLGNGFGSRMRELPSGAPELLKRRLSLVQPNRFWQSAPYFLVDMSDHDPQHPEVQIDFTSREISPYVPEDAPTIAETMQTADLPYISALDLLVFKIHCCGMRPYRAKRQTDAEDAVALVQYLQSTGPILLSDKQKQFVAEGLDGLLEWNFRSREWWTGNVGLA